MERSKEILAGHSNSNRCRDGYNRNGGCRNKGIRTMGHIWKVAIALALVIMTVQTFILFAPLLTITAFTTDRRLYEVGSTIVVETKSIKWPWTVWFCNATSGRTFVTDGSGRIRVYEEAFGFNDGTKSGMARDINVTPGYVKGSVQLQKRVTYQCGMFERSQFSPIAIVNIT